MREILFRGKIIDENDQWVYGDLIFPDRMFSNNKDRRGIFGVDPSTVGQYTGMNDMNGKQIFEGDICDFYAFNCNGEYAQYRGVVVYSDSMPLPMLWKSVDNKYYMDDCGFCLPIVRYHDEKFEVIGNVHDNPELLEIK